MKKSRMTPAQFVKDNLPDYDSRLTHFFGGDDENPLTVTQMGVRRFTEVNFDEALENFRQSVWRQACEAQREECAGTVRFESRRYLPERLRDESYYACKNADIPEPPKNE